MPCSSALFIMLYAILSFTLHIAQSMVPFHEMETAFNKQGCAFTQQWVEIPRARLHKLKLTSDSSKATLVDLVEVHLIQTKLKLICKVTDKVPSVATATCPP